MDFSSKEGDNVINLNRDTEDIIKDKKKQRDRNKAYWDKKVNSKL